MEEKLQQITEFYAEAFQHFGKPRTLTSIKVEFYAYVGINHTIKLRNEKIFVRIAEICRDMPLEIQRALAYILVAKLLKKRIPKEATENYRSFIKTAEMREKNSNSRKEKGRKIISTAKGKFFDLELMFDEINEVYFENSIPKQTLTWSARKTYRILGHYDSNHQTIVISKSLDEKNVPNFVVQYVLFHEMLHVKHPTKIVNDRRAIHTPEFRREEKEFDFYTQAENWIEENIVKIKRDVKGKKSFLRRLLNLAVK